MIVLGSYDPSVTKEALAAYRTRVKKMTGIIALRQWDTQLRDEGRWVDYTPLASTEQMKVAELQQFLHDAGFRPHGEINGICGYRTAAAIFLFQEYVRTIEGIAGIGYPDGQFGKTTLSHLQRWQTGKLRADWAGSSDAEPSAEHARWFKLLNATKAQYLASPGAIQTKVNAADACDTAKVADWDFDPDKVTSSASVAESRQARCRAWMILSSCSFGARCSRSTALPNQAPSQAMNPSFPTSCRGSTATASAGITRVRARRYSRP